MVTKFKKILELLKKDWGKVYLLALIQLDTPTEKWSIDVSVENITDASAATKFFDYLYNTLKENLSDKELSEISRVSLHTPEEHIVTLFNEAVEVDDGGVVTLSNTKLNGYTIEKAYVFASNKYEEPII